ncbi:hypothetical protein OE88DRAFT_1659976 [Heliocybe sulcata]|uniref:Uncharacterized protein n=1 Tax=Heliocybe sulcata TaxID=5364 RepID=A0A5C3N1E6_9AGAM|nr:hypothetical protein OE88DRAFT_1659976 [Heliocybe sulcata]
MEASASIAMLLALTSDHLFTCVYPMPALLARLHLCVSANHEESAVSYKFRLERDAGLPSLSATIEVEPIHSRILLVTRFLKTITADTKTSGRAAIRSGRPQAIPSQVMNPAQADLADKSGTKRLSDRRRLVGGIKGQGPWIEGTDPRLGLFAFHIL